MVRTSKVSTADRRHSVHIAGPGARRLGMAAALLAVGALLAGCGNTDVDSRPMQKQSDGSWSREDPNQKETIFGKGGLDLFGNKKGSGEGGTGGTGVGVNAFLWRAALDTVGFMPLNSADPFGGVIITDWYQPQSSPNERFKVNLYILGRSLRADGLKAAVFRQVRDQSTGGWLDAAVEPKVNTDFENAVLTRARQLRMAAADADNNN